MNDKQEICGPLMKIEEEDDLSEIKANSSSDNLVFEGLLPEDEDQIFLSLRNSIQKDKK